MTDHIIEVEMLSCAYGHHKVLSDISFSIGSGEIVCVIGKSGCGKTTLLKAMIGLLAFQSGRVHLFGVSVANREAVEKSGVLKKMGVLFQRGALLNSMTVAENVALPLEMHTALTQTEREERTAECLRNVRLTGVEGKFPTELSGGMVKRAALARALSMNPKLLFCDEPSAGLDPVTTRSLDALLLELRDRFGMTVVVITHDPASIRRMADRIIMLDQGTLVFDGPLTAALDSSVLALREFFGLSPD